MPNRRTSNPQGGLFSPQIPLNLEPRRPDLFEDFVRGPNEQAFMAVRQLLEQTEGSLFLSGPEGSGKSHLLNAACHLMRERSMAAFYIALRRLPEEAAAGLRGLQIVDLVCVDDLESIAGNPAWEQALFNCFNEVHAARGRLLVSSRKPLSALSFGLPDLASRLGWGVSQALQLPGDEDKREVLRRQARRLHIELPADVQDYLLKHGKRDMSSLLRSLQRLRDAAFVEKRRITVPLLREVLKAGNS